VSREELERFLTRRSRADVERLLSDADREGNDFDVAEVFDQNLYDSLSEYDRNVRLSRWLSLRFTGRDTEGRLAEQAVEEILGALRREIDGASSNKDGEALRLDLVGFSRGSAILHLAPVGVGDVQADEPVASAQEELHIIADHLDDALAVVTRLHNTVEQEGDVQRFSGQESLLRGFTALSDALDKHDLDMGITWRSATGRRRTSQLTSSGRDYARQFFDRSEQTDVIQVNGRVVELDIAGSFDVKAGTAINSPRYHIMTGSEGTLLGLHLELGQVVNVRVRRHVETNRIGLAYTPRYEFLNMIKPGETMR
jgi:hypothetical protein